MSKLLKPTSYALGAISIGYLMAFAPQEASAQYVTSLGQTPSQVRLCPDRKCQQIFEHTFVQGKKIVIYEKKNGWVRLSGTLAPEQLQAKFPEGKLPKNAAFWIPSTDLPPTVAAQFHSEEVKPPTKKKPKTAAYAKLPKNPPLPTPRPAQKVAVKAELVAKVVEGEKKPELKLTKPEAKPEAKPAEPEAKKDASPLASLNTKTDVKQASTEAKTEPEVETDSFGNPVVKLPSKLTKELKDKRLAKLPRKPQNGLDMKSVITIRYHGLRLLNDGSCKSIQEGGKSLSLADWIYVVCEGDGQYRQFPVQ